MSQKSREEKRRKKKKEGRRTKDDGEICYNTFFEFSFTSYFGEIY